MGMTDDMNSVAIALSSIESSVSGIYDYLGNIKSNIEDSYNRGSATGAIRASLKPMIALFKKAGLRVEDKDRIEQSISELAKQVAAKTRISGFGWIAAEEWLYYDLETLWLNTKNYLNVSSGLRKRLPSDILSKADGVINAAEGALSFIDLTLRVREYESFKNKKQANDWLLEVIERRKRPIPFAVSRYLELQRMKNYLRAINDVSYGNNHMGDISSMLAQAFNRAFESLAGFSRDFSELAVLAEMLIDANLSLDDMAGMNEIVSMWESMLGLSADAMIAQESSAYTIQIVKDNKTQTITTLNDPADFLAALTGL